jgi:hypothetical protein
MHVHFQLLETFGKFKKKFFMVTNFSLSEFFVTIKNFLPKKYFLPLREKTNKWLTNG